MSDSSDDVNRLLRMNYCSAFIECRKVTAFFSKGNLFCVRHEWSFLAGCQTLFNLIAVKMDTGLAKRLDKKVIFHRGLCIVGTDLKKLSIRFIVIVGGSKKANFSGRVLLRLLAGPPYAEAYGNLTN